MVYRRMARSTPARRPPFRPWPSWWRRVAAGIVDYLIATIPFLLVQSLYVAPRVDSEAVSWVENQRVIWETFYASPLGPLFQFGFPIWQVGYFVVLHALFGQTLGKKIAGLVVITTDGTQCDWPAALKRALVYPVFMALIPYFTGTVMLVNGLWPLIDSDSRSLGDIVGRTRVVRADRP